MNVNWFAFADLSVEQLYSILALRSQVFVVDQHCAYQDADGKDQVAQHLLLTEDNCLLAYLRLFPPTKEENFLRFGRVLTAKSARKKGHGKKLMQELLNYCKTHFPGLEVKCSAQAYLQEFYKSFGFEAASEIYVVDGIPHLNMCFLACLKSRKNVFSSQPSKELS